MTGNFRTLLVVTVLVAGMGVAVQAMAQNPDSQYDRHDSSQMTDRDGHCDHWYRNVTPGHRARCSWYNDRDGDWCTWDDCRGDGHDGQRHQDRKDDRTDRRQDGGRCW